MENVSSSESIRLLEGMGVSLSAQNLVHYAYKGSITEVQHLINAGINPDSKSSEGLIAIFGAISNGHIEIVKYLKERNANLNILDANGNCPLSISIGKNRKEIFDFLIENGAVANGPEGCSYPPIITASFSGEIYYVDKLVSAGADIEVLDKDGDRPVKVAFNKKNTLAYDRLIELGAKALTDEEKEKSKVGNKIVELLKAVYGKRAFLFLGINLFCFIIIFLVLDEKTGGGLFARIFTFLFCTIVGGLLGIWWSRKNTDAEEMLVKGFRRGAGTLLVFATLISWSNNGYVRSVSSSSDSSSSYSSSGSHTCTQCGRSYSGNGWSTAGGEQFLYSSDPGYDACCSKSCAYDSQPESWK